MVKAILEGQKTQTRRIVKPQPTEPWLGWITSSTERKHEGCACWANHPAMTKNFYIKPPCQVGDTLWVRETWCQHSYMFFYKADMKCTGCTEDGTCLPVGVEKHITCELCDYTDGYFKWHPSIHMPRSAARLFLKVTAVRVERLQDITEDGAKAEGTYPIYDAMGNVYSQGGYSIGYRLAFEDLWNSIYHNWNENPWVWVIEFERMV